MRKSNVEENSSTRRTTKSLPADIPTTNEVERWFKIYFDAAERGAVPDFDPTSVIETELDVMRRVIHPVHGTLVFIRGKLTGSSTPTAM